mmetsp:Transcript_37259/g.81033  ORF Transcript_37259/g.81033 Transcript_37259/m.81033 type:complete len:82 (-) Transcript_37259:2-247(-)
MKEQEEEEEEMRKKQRLANFQQQSTRLRTQSAPLHWQNKHEWVDKRYLVSSELLARASRTLVPEHDDRGRGEASSHDEEAD